MSIILRDSGRDLAAVITDYMMPQMDGIRLTEVLKADREFASIPVIILTSAGEQGLVKRFDEAGAAACLPKPAMRQQLDTLMHVLEAAERGKSKALLRPKPAPR